MIVRRRSIIAGLACGALVGCKRNRAPVVAEVWDDEPAVAQADALGALAPPWPSPVRGQLDDGLVTFWLHEPETPAMAIRLLVPTSARPDAPPSEAIAAIAEHLGFDWQRRVQKAGVSVALVHGPHRFEVVARGAAAQLAAAIAGLRATVSAANPPGIEGARDRVVERMGGRTNRELAAATTATRLSGVDELLDTSRATKLTRATMHAQWHALLDPRQCVLLVHSGEKADAAKGDLRRLAEAWRPEGRKGGEFIDQATRRLRLRTPPVSTGARLLADPPAPVIVAPSGAGRSTIAAGRIIALANATDRAMARLAQRIAQEELEASIVIHGDHAVWLVSSEISRNAPDDDVKRLVESMAVLANTRHPRQRLFGAAQLWLGARVVEASLGGEDWTALFASAIDLADNDGQIAGALAKDALAQLAATGDALEAWTKKWLQPRTGEPGWAWSGAGLDGTATKRIARLTPVA